MWIVFVPPHDVDPSLLHRLNPRLVNKALRFRRHAVDASVLLDADLTHFEKKSRLHQRRQQAATVDLHYPRRNGFSSSRHEAVWIPQVGDMNRAGWSMLGNDVPRI